MLREPAEMLFEKAVKVLEYFDWYPYSEGGSHFVYTKDDRLLTIIKHKNKIGRQYIKRINKALNLEEWYEKNQK